MCTLSYIPHNKGFTLTHNRDELSLRPASNTIQQRQTAMGKQFFPQDLEARGSWIAMAEHGMSSCILNGGKHPYVRKTPYRKSRGLIVLDSLNFEDPEEFFSKSDFEGVEPFTLIMRSREKLCAIIHDESENELRNYDLNTVQVWSSTTLYAEEVRKKREIWFAQWLKNNPQPSPRAIRNFHLSAGDGDGANDLVMSRWGILQTLSISQIAQKRDKAHFHYHQLVQNSEHNLKVGIKY